MRIAGKVAVVTGGASGLGAGTTDALLAAGASVVVLARDAARGDAFVESRPGARFLATDASDSDAVRRSVDAVIEQHGRIDILVGCAGTADLTPVVGDDRVDHAIANFERILRVNLLGSFVVLKHVANRMIDNAPDPDTGERGSVVLTSSIGAFDTQELTGGYGASKAGLNALTVPAMRELAPHGIRVNTIAPGLFFTEMSMSLPWVDELAKLNEFPKRGGDPSEFAALALHMIGNPYLNGEVVRLDAGARPSSRGPRETPDS